MAITVYGASDDLIILEGDIVEEFNSWEDEAYIAFSNGFVLELNFGEDGFWAIRAVVNPDPELLTITPRANTKTRTTDVAELRADADWAIYGSGLAHNKH